MNKVGAASFTLGADPELFLARGGKVIGAERVIPQTGIDFNSHHLNPAHGASSYGKIVLDGVQAEINYNPSQASQCRQTFSTLTMAAMIALNQFLKSDKKFEGITLYTLGSVIDMDEDELQALSPNARMVGCQPSFNYFDKGATIEIDMLTYRTRSAGGHIHFGLLNTYGPKIMDMRKDLVPLCDIFMGLISVLVDRDPRMSERRQLYGLAGEYRLPKHGLEYRTLSNFWLRSYPLLSMVFGLAKQALGVLYWSRLGVIENRWDAEAALYKLMDMEKVREAINTNNVELAKSQWQQLKQFLSDHSDSSVGLNKWNLAQFEHFLSRIEKDGLHTLFPQSPLEYWPPIAKNGLGYGFETYLSHVMDNDMLRGANATTNISI